jgi:hypothetical protein
MAKPTGKELQDSHNKGEKDASEGKYNPTVGVGVLDELTTHKDTLDGWKEIDDAYSKGWNNARK